MNKDDYKTIDDWNSIGRVVIKNSKGINLKGYGLYFHVNDTVLNTDLAQIFLVNKQRKEDLKKQKKLGFLMASKTKPEWNAIGYIVKKGSRGVYSESKKTILFSFDDTCINKPLARKFLRHHQYHLVKKARKHIYQNEGEVISDILF